MKRNLKFIMVVLRNIVRDNFKKIIEADYYPDGGNLFGHVVVDMTTGEIISMTQIEGIAWRSALAHARKGLEMLTDVSVLPAQKTIYWY